MPNKKKFSLHEYGLTIGGALPGLARGYKLSGEKLRPRYPAEYAMTGAKNARDLRQQLAVSGMERRGYGQAPQRIQKLAIKFYMEVGYSSAAFRKLPRAARRIVKEVHNAEMEQAEREAWGNY